MLFGILFGLGNACSECRFGAAIHAPSAFPFREGRFGAAIYAPHVPFPFQIPIPDWSPRQFYLVLVIPQK